MFLPRRLALRADFAVPLILRSRRLTRCVCCAHSVPTGGGQSVDVRAARAGRRTPLLAAPEIALAEPHLPRAAPPLRDRNECKSDATKKMARTNRAEMRRKGEPLKADR